MSKEKILVFIPVYNCEKQIPRVLEQLNGEIKNYISEIIVVNNISTDNTAAVVENYLKQHPDMPCSVLTNDKNYNLGGSHKVAFGYAVKNGFDYVIVLHGDDQGRISDFLPLIKSGEYRNYDCCLGARFMKGSKLEGYSKIRIWGNYVFNAIFSLTVHKSIKDLGSGLNMYKSELLKDGYYIKYPDTLYFNDFMIMASVYYKHKMLFYPISWREEDQVSNNKLISFSLSLLKLVFAYTFNRKKLLSSDMRTDKISDYTYKITYSNINREV